MIEPIDDFWVKYPQYWSVWFGTGSVVMTLLEILNLFNSVLPVLEGLVPPGVFAGLSLICGIGVLISRGLKQTIVVKP